MVHKWGRDEKGKGWLWTVFASGELREAGFYFISTGGNLFLMMSCFQPNVAQEKANLINLSSWLVNNGDFLYLAEKLPLNFINYSQAQLTRSEIQFASR